MKKYMSMSEKIKKALDTGENSKEKVLNDPTYQSNISLEKEIIEKQILLAIQEHSILENGIVKLVAYNRCFWIRGSSSFFIHDFDESKLYPISGYPLKDSYPELYLPYARFSTRNFYAKNYSTSLYSSDIISCFEDVIKNNFGAKRIRWLGNLGYADIYSQNKYCIMKGKIKIKF